MKDLQEILLGYVQDNSRRSHIIISSGLEVSVKELALLIAQCLGFDKNIFFSGEGNLGQRKVAVSVVLSSLFPNFEFTSLREGLNSTVEWFTQEKGRPSSVGRASLS